MERSALPQVDDPLLLTSRTSSNEAIGHNIPSRGSLLTSGTFIAGAQQKGQGIMTKRRIDENRSFRVTKCSAQLTLNIFNQGKFSTSAYSAAAKNAHRIMINLAQQKEQLSMRSSNPLVNDSTASVSTPSSGGGANPATTTFPDNLHNAQHVSRCSVDGSSRSSNSDSAACASDASGSAKAAPVTFDFELTETTQFSDKGIFGYHASFTKHVPHKVFTLSHNKSVTVNPKYVLIVTSSTDAAVEDEQAFRNLTTEQVG